MTAFLPMKQPDHRLLVVICPTWNRFYRWQSKRGNHLQHRLALGLHKEMLPSYFTWMIKHLSRRRGYEIRYVGTDGSWMDPEIKKQLERYSYPTDLMWALSRTEVEHGSEAEQG